MEKENNISQNNRRSFPLWAKIIVSLLVIAACFFASIFFFLISIFSLHAGTFLFAIIAANIAVFFLLLRWITGLRPFMWIGLTFLAAGIIAPSAVLIHEWWTDGRFERISGDIDWAAYEPFAPGNKLAKADAPAEYMFDGAFPRINGAYALYPIYAAGVQALTTNESYSAEDTRSAGSDHIFDSINHNLVDIIFGLMPSEAQLAEARRWKVRYKLTPVARDAFVFFVHKDNPAENLTIEQIRGIYSGRITTWRELGVPLDDKLLPFQRNKNSGSQTALERLMAGENIIEPISEDRVGGMGGIIQDVADYRNKLGALGFSFRYYSTDMMRTGKIKLLAINGVKPTTANIASGEYPIVSEAYGITALYYGEQFHGKVDAKTRAQRKQNADKLLRFLTSDTGRKLVEDTGYVAPKNRESFYLP